MDTTTVIAGPLDTLLAEGRLLTKLGSTPVVVFWDGDRPRALEDRCPHMGFPLHRGTVSNGTVTCHWHHARFDLESGCTFDLFADDVRSFDAHVEDGDVVVSARPAGADIETLERRLREGIQDRITLVIAKSVLALLARDVPPARIIGNGLAYAAAYRGDGWGPGMTVAQIAANLVPRLAADQQAQAITQALSFLARDTSGAPFFPVAPLASDVPLERVATWYRGFIENREGGAAERALATALTPTRVKADIDGVERMMFAACTDHVFLDEGHIVDYTNKAFEAIAVLGAEAAASLLPTLVRPTARALRHEERSDWRTPIDLVSLADGAIDRLMVTDGTGAGVADLQISELARALLAEDPAKVVEALVAAGSAGASIEQLARAVALAAGLRLVHFHIQNDVSDWDTVHHSFTTANAVHQAARRHPTADVLRGVVHGALRVYLDRFLNVPAAREPATAPRSLEDLEACWDRRSGVDEAGAIVSGYLAAGGGADTVISELCRVLYREDAGFHWHQTVDAAVAQVAAWPEESNEVRLLLVGVTRWLAAHTPTLRQTDQVMAIARRLERGEALYDES